MTVNLSIGLPAVPAGLIREELVSAGDELQWLGEGGGEFDTRRLRDLARQLEHVADAADALQR